MLAEHSSSSGESNCGTDRQDRPKPVRRQQYTLKGVEEEAIELMRLAANQDGMKIGPWVSSILKDAAKKSLDIDNGYFTATAPMKRDFMSSLNPTDFAPRELYIEAVNRCVLQISNQIRVLQEHQLSLLKSIQDAP